VIVRNLEQMETKSTKQETETADGDAIAPHLQRLDLTSLAIPSLPLRSSVQSYFDRSIP